MQMVSFNGYSHEKINNNLNFTCEALESPEWFKIQARYERIENKKGEII